MKDVLHIESQATDEDGVRVEPEQQPVTRVVEGRAEVQGSISHAAEGSMRTVIEIEQPAGVIADDLRTKCINCRHFDNAGFIAAKKRLQGTAEGREQLQTLRTTLIDHNNLGLVDVQSLSTDSDLDVMGLCRAFSELRRDDVAVHPLSNCPKEMQLFQAKDRAAEARGSAAYDAILLPASGDVS